MSIDWSVLLHFNANIIPINNEPRNDDCTFLISIFMFTMSYLCSWTIEYVRSRVKTPPSGRFVNNGGVPHNFQANLVMRGL